MKSIETERLLLRKFTTDDLYDLYEYARDERIGPNAGWSPHKSLDESGKILENFIKNDEVFALHHKLDNKVIGSLGLHYRELDQYGLVYEIGYVLSHTYQGKGLMNEAIIALIDYCFFETELEELYVGHFSENIKSRKVIERIKFTYLKDIEYQSRDYGVKTTKLYVLKKADYLKERDKL